MGTVKQHTYKVPIGNRVSNDTIPVRYRAKLKPEADPTVFGHHRGGWTHVVEGLVSQFYTKDGTVFISDVGTISSTKVVLTEPWVGVVHQTPKSNYPSFPDLEQMVQDEFFKQSLQTCRGLFVLSTVVKGYLAPRLPGTPICLVYYPLTPFCEEFKFSMAKFEANPQRKVLFIGEFLRNFQAIFDLPTPSDLKKVLIKARDVEFDNWFNTDKEKIELKMNDTVDVWMKQVPDEEYDKLLSENVVFLNLFDIAACTTIIECLGRGTPLVVNRLPGAEEYLGKDYPLFYSTLEEASQLLSSTDRLREGHEYLKKRIQEIDLSEEGFLAAVVNSAIYRQLPLPRSQQHSKEGPGQCIFPEFEVTFVAYVTEVSDISEKLEKIRETKGEKSVQMLLWCHNNELFCEVRKLYDPFKGDITCHMMEASCQYDPSRVYKALKELSHGDVTAVLYKNSVLRDDTIKSLVKGNRMMYVTSDSVQPLWDVTPLFQGDVTTFDIALIMCQYKRVHDLGKILGRLVKQNFEGTFQLIIWNNNLEISEEVVKTCKPFMKQLNIELIHSSCNFYCGIRFAIKDLIKSKLMLIIDDDIIPEEGYIKRFVDKYREYGPRTVVSCRGHIFNHSSIDEENPHQAWENWDSPEFADQFMLREQQHEDCEVHFQHADCLLISKDVLEEVLSQYQIPRKDFILVDDYWLSFVLSHHMGVRLMRIKADDVMSMTESAEDEGVALYRNPKVHEQRVDFCIYHNRLNWPKSKPIDFPRN